MRRLAFTLAALAAASPLAAQDHSHHHHQHAAHADAQAGTLPQGWQARFDRANASMANVTFVEVDGGHHVTLGPSGIFYNPEHTASGQFHARATFTQSKPTPHPEGYGLLVGGQQLDGPGQDYLYFLVRQDGRFLIKHRAGSETHTLKDWTEHAAVARVADGSAATNTLAVETLPRHTRFLVNGQEVARLDNHPQLNTSGVVGLRVNHNLELHVANFEVQPGRD